MSGFSAELLDYLEGRITFEEFDRRRDERNPEVNRTGPNREDGVSPVVQQAFASILGEAAAAPSSDEEEDSLSYVDDEGDQDYRVEEEAAAKETTKGRKRRPNKLPQALRGLMGEANIRYARGEKEDAILMCMEIIRQYVDKALQFGLIAAHLNPSDHEEWIRLAEMSLEQDNIRQAVICYSKAIKYDPTNVRYLWERSSLHMRLGEHKQCMDGYRRILSLLAHEDGEHFMQLSKDMAKSYYESNDLPSALSVVEEALTRHPGLVTDDFVNMAAELYICSRQFKEALQVCIRESVFCSAFRGRMLCPQDGSVSLFVQVLVKFTDILLIRAESSPEGAAQREPGTEGQQEEEEPKSSRDSEDSREFHSGLPKNEPQRVQVSF
uniref:Uncharacterized protein n=1 Tax=Cyprinodon variegatus TaxID=28743 RepID=A0A3Q2CBT9_CYPVA